MRRFGFKIFIWVILEGSIIYPLRALYLPPKWDSETSSSFSLPQLEVVFQEQQSEVAKWIEDLQRSSPPERQISAARALARTLRDDPFNENLLEITGALRDNLSRIFHEFSSSDLFPSSLQREIVSDLSEGWLQILQGAVVVELHPLIMSSIKDLGDIFSSMVNFQEDLVNQFVTRVAENLNSSEDLISWVSLSSLGAVIPYILDEELKNQISLRIAEKLQSDSFVNVLEAVRALNVIVPSLVDGETKIILLREFLKKGEEFINYGIDISDFLSVVNYFLRDEDIPWEEKHGLEEVLFSVLEDARRTVREKLLSAKSLYYFASQNPRLLDDVIQLLGLNGREEELYKEHGIVIFDPKGLAPEEEMVTERMVEMINVLPKEFIAAITGIQWVEPNEIPGGMAGADPYGLIYLTSLSIPIDKRGRIDSKLTIFRNALIHEIGHVVNFRMLSPQKWVEFKDLSRMSFSEEFVNGIGIDTYSREELPYEDFARLFTAYIEDTKSLVDHAKELRARGLAHLEKKLKLMVDLFRIPDTNQVYVYQVDGDGHIIREVAELGSDGLPII